MNFFSKNFLKYSKRYFAENIHSYTHKDNPKVFLTISKNGEKVGNIVFELYKNHCPKTAENFEKLCTGDNKDKLTYKGNKFHRIINGFMAQGGDITKGNGTGGKSIYGEKFRDENLKLFHYKRGQLSMANSGPDTNGSQFFITFLETPWLNSYHVVFGEMVEGEEVLKEIEAVGTRNGTPKAEIQIIDCGLKI